LGAEKINSARICDIFNRLFRSLGHKYRLDLPASWYRRRLVDSTRKETSSVTVPADFRDQNSPFCKYNMNHHLPSRRWVAGFAGKAPGTVSRGGHGSFQPAHIV
jgi:hypothetical protein